MKKVSPRLIICAELRELFRDPDGGYSGGSYVPIELDLSRKCTEGYVRKQADLGVRAQIEPYRKDGEVNRKYVIGNFSSIVSRFEREKKREAERKGTRRFRGMIKT